MLAIANPLFSQEYSLRFHGSGAYDADRVKILLDNPHRPVDVGGNFTLEFWMKADPGDNDASSCQPYEWYFGNIITDRDVFGDGDYGDYGVVLCNRRIVVGVQRLSLGHGGVVGNTIVDDGQWHHIAVTRTSSNGAVRLFVDGMLDASSSSSPSTGDISYRNNRYTSYPNSDPYLVFGAEKHDYPGSLYYRGWIDEFRLSNNIRYTSNFTRPSAPFSADINTVALYRFNESSENVLSDVSNATGGPSHGVVKFGGTPVGPVWSPESPFSSSREVYTTDDYGPGSLRYAIASAPNDADIYLAPYMQNQTITLSQPLVINKTLRIHAPVQQNLSLTIYGDGPVIIVQVGGNLTLNQLRIVSGTGSVARAIHNLGTLTLNNVLVEDDAQNNETTLFNQCQLNVNGISRVGSE